MIVIPIFAGETSNMDVLFICISLLLLLTGIIGAVLPVLPGLVLSYAGLLIYKFGTSNDLWSGYLWIFAGLLIGATLLNYLLPAKLNRRYGGSRWGSIGSLLGLVIGIFFIPIPFGFLIGMLGGVFVAEWIHSSHNPVGAFRAMKGAFIGFLLGTGIHLGIAVAMLIVVVLNLLVGH